jgi:MEDS: MEthanogen/methylotroph, DcmR Sensory domain
VNRDSTNVPYVLSDSLAPALDGGACPHVAVLLRSEAEFTPVVASFYMLGAKRGGWLVHRSVEPQRDRDALTGAGLDVHALEADRRLAVEEIRRSEPPEHLPRRLDAGFSEALARGMSALWSSHSPVPADSDSFNHAMQVERAWEEHFRDRPVITLCPYIVGGLDAPAALSRLSALGAGHHDGVLLPSESGLEVFKPARTAGNA